VTLHTLSHKSDNSRENRMVLYSCLSSYSLLNGDADSLLPTITNSNLTLGL
jgi:hypothetical protein